MEEQKQEKKKFQKWPIVVLFVLLILAVGITFAWLRITIKSDKVNVIKAGSLSMILDDETSDGILLQKAIPMSYQQGLTTINYEFTLTNNGSKGDYTISLIDEATYTDAEGAQVTISDTDRIADTKIRYILLKDGEEASSSKSMLLSEALNRVIDSGTIENGTTITYSLRIWIDSKASNEVMGQIFNARLQLNATQHKEEASPITPAIGPVLYEFGTPTLTSTTDYTTLGKNVFATLTYGEATGGVCINDGGLFCLKANDYDNSVASLLSHFGGDQCIAYSSNFLCNDFEFFNCTASADGTVGCGDLQYGGNCAAYADGTFICAD